MWLDEFAFDGSDTAVNTTAVKVENTFCPTLGSSFGSFQESGTLKVFAKGVVDELRQRVLQLRIKAIIQGGRQIEMRRITQKVFVCMRQNEPKFHLRDGCEKVHLDQTGFAVGFDYVSFDTQFCTDPTLIMMQIPEKSVGHGQVQREVWAVLRHQI